MAYEAGSGGGGRKREEEQAQPQAVEPIGASVENFQNSDSRDIREQVALNFYDSSKDGGFGSMGDYIMNYYGALEEQGNTPQEYELPTTPQEVEAPQEDNTAQKQQQETETPSMAEIIPEAETEQQTEEPQAQQTVTLNSGISRETNSGANGLGTVIPQYFDDEDTIEKQLKNQIENLTADDALRNDIANTIERNNLWDAVTGQGYMPYDAEFENAWTPVNTGDSKFAEDMKNFWRYDPNAEYAFDSPTALVFPDENYVPPKDNFRGDTQAVINYIKDKTLAGIDAYNDYRVRKNAEEEFSKRYDNSPVAAFEDLFRNNEIGAGNYSPEQRNAFTDSVTPMLSSLGYSEEEISKARDAAGLGYLTNQYADRYQDIFSGGDNTRGLYDVNQLGSYLNIPNEVINNARDAALRNSNAGDYFTNQYAGRYQDIYNNNNAGGNVDDITKLGNMINIPENDLVNYQSEGLSNIDIEGAYNGILPDEEIARIRDASNSPAEEAYLLTLAAQRNDEAREEYADKMVAEQATMPDSYRKSNNDKTVQSYRYDLNPNLGAVVEALYPDFVPYQYYGTTRQNPYDIADPQEKLTREGVRDDRNAVPNVDENYVNNEYLDMVINMDTPEPQERLSLFDNSDGTFKITTKPSYDEIIADDTFSSVYRGSVDGQHEDVQTVVMDKEVFARKADQFMNDHPELQKLVDLGVVTLEDIADHFFKKIKLVDGNKNVPRTYGGSYKRYGGGGGGRRGGGGGGGGGSSYQGSGNANQDGRKEVYNVMKNWEF